jgi:hypothetical protein
MKLESEFILIESEPNMPAKPDSFVGAGIAVGGEKACKGEDIVLIEFVLLVVPLVGDESDSTEEPVLVFFFSGVPALESFCGGGLLLFAVGSEVVVMASFVPT